MSEGLRRIAQVLKVLGWLWLAMFVVLECITGYGRERDLTRDEKIALYERQTQTKMIDVVGLAARRRTEAVTSYYLGRMDGHSRGARR